MDGNARFGRSLKTSAVRHAKTGIARTYATRLTGLSTGLRTPLSWVVDGGTGVRRRGVRDGLELMR